MLISSIEVILGTTSNLLDECKNILHTKNPQLSSSDYSEDKETQANKHQIDLPVTTKKKIDWSEINYINNPSTSWLLQQDYLSIMSYYQNDINKNNNQNSQ